MGRIARLFLRLVLILLCFGPVTADPVSVRHQISEGRLYTAWGTFDSLDMMWFQEDSSYIGTSAADGLALLDTADDAAPKGSLFLLLEIDPVESGQEAVFLGQMLSNLGEFRRTRWEGGVLSGKINGDGKAGASLVRGANTTIAVICFGTTYEESQFLHFLKSFQPDTGLDKFADLLEQHLANHGKTNIQGFQVDSRAVEAGVQPLGQGKITLPATVAHWGQMTMDGVGKGETYLGVHQSEVVLVMGMTLPTSRTMSPSEFEAFGESFLKASLDASNIRLETVDTPFPASLSAQWVSGSGTKLGDLLQQLKPGEPVHGQGYFLCTEREVLAVLGTASNRELTLEILKSYQPPDGAKVGATGFDQSSSFQKLFLAFFAASMAVAVLVPLLTGGLNRFLKRESRLNPYWISALLLCVGLIVFMAGTVWISGEFGRLLLLLALPSFLMSIAILNLAPMFVYFLLGARWRRKNQR